MKLCPKCEINTVSCLCEPPKVVLDPRRKVSTWPMKSEAMGCHPSQVGEAMAEAAKRGVPTEFTATGEAIFTSKAHRKLYCESHGYFDRDASYGDPQRGAYQKRFGDE